VRVIQLDRCLVRQAAHIAVILDVAAHDVLNGGAGEEELLPQPQFLPGRGGIRRVQHPHQRIGAHLRGERARVIARVERIERDRIERGGAPQAQGVHALALPTDHGGIEGIGLDHLGRCPAHRPAIADNLAAKTDAIGAFPSFELPRIAVGEPGFGQLHLPAFVDALAEHPVDVADAVAEGGDVEAGEAFHEARCQSPQPAIAERGVRLQFLQRGEIEPVLLQRRRHVARGAKVRQGIAQQAADQEFEAEVIDPLGSGLVRGRGGCEPAVDDVVTQREDSGVVPVMRLGRAFGLADAVAQRA